VVGLSILTKFTENTQPGGHRRQESLSCHRRMIGISGILSLFLSFSFLLSGLATLGRNSTSVLNSCFLMDSRNRVMIVSNHLDPVPVVCPFLLAPLIHVSEIELSLRNALCSAIRFGTVIVRNTFGLN